MIGVEGPRLVPPKRCHLLFVKDGNVADRSSASIRPYGGDRKRSAVAGYRVPASLHDLSILRYAPADGIIIDRRIDGRVTEGIARYGMRLRIMNEHVHLCEGIPGCIDPG